MYIFSYTFVRDQLFEVLLRGNQGTEREAYGGDIVGRETLLCVRNGGSNE